MEHLEPTPERQPARVPPTGVLLVRIVWPVFTFAGFAFLVVITVLRPDRFDIPWFSFAVVLAFALAYAARVVVRIRQMRRWRDGRTDQTSKTVTLDDRLAS